MDRWVHVCGLHDYSKQVSFMDYWTFAREVAESAETRGVCWSFASVFGNTKSSGGIGEGNLVVLDADTQNKLTKFLDCLRQFDGRRDESADSRLFLVISRGFS